MDAQQFTFWLHGFFEISDSKTLNETQVQIIKDHLDLVFDKVTPKRVEPSKNPLEQRKYCVKKEREKPLCSLFKPYTVSKDSDSLGLIEKQFDLFAVGSGKVPYNYGEYASY